MGTTLQFALQKWGFARFARFSSQGRKVDVSYYVSGATSRRGEL